MSTDLQERFARYLESGDLADYEAIGLFYAAFIFLGLLLVGWQISYSGGRAVFQTGGWADTPIEAGAGLGIDLGFGLLSNTLALKDR